MGRTRRTLIGILTAALVVAGGAAPALAAPPAPAVVDPGDGCDTPPGDGYAPPARCELLIARAEAICLAAAPVLDYAVEAVGTTDSTVTITWVNPDGEDLVDEGLPLSGRVFWPGTVVQDGVVVDWPGWTPTPDGSWTEHDAYDFTRPEVQVIFSVNPEASTVITYPPETAVCANPPTRAEQVAGVTVTSDVLAAPEVTQSQVLAVTGANSWPLLAGAGALLLLGAGLVTTSVRRRRVTR
ncbi:peptidase [Cellulomonas sp. Marseille-Q8402]